MHSDCRKHFEICLDCVTCLRDHYANTEREGSNYGVYCGICYDLVVTIEGFTSSVFS